MKRAWVLGATGATGTALVELLLGNDEYSEVHVFVRRLSSCNTRSSTSTW